MLIYGKDLIGFFGGIIGLCVGFSLLSGAELIYFFTLRLFLDLRKEKNSENKVDIVDDPYTTDKEILSESFDAVFSINNSTVQLIDTEETKAEEKTKVKESTLNEKKPDLIPEKEKLKTPAATPAKKPPTAKKKAASQKK